MSYDDWKAHEPDYLDPGRLRTAEDREDYMVPSCDACGAAVIYPVTLAGVGICCSRDCMNRLERQFSAAMEARRG